MAQPVPLMPHATASWLVDNTALSFEQIATFCGLHILEVQAIADETAGTKYTGRDPVRAHELTIEEIERGQNDPEHRLVMSKVPEPSRRTKGPRYTPVSKRQDKPDGIAWLVKHYPEVSDGAIGNLIGTTRTTIAAIRDRSHWNSANIVAKDPVALGLCSQRELDALIAKAGKKAGVAPPVEDSRLDGDRAALIDSLRAERQAAHDAADAEAALMGDPEPAARPAADQGAAHDAATTDALAEADALFAPRVRDAGDADRQADA